MEEEHEGQQRTNHPRFRAARGRNRRGFRKDDETAVPGTNDPNGLHGSLRSAFAAAMEALPQASSLPAPDEAEIGYAKPMAMADITDGWGNTRPELFQQDGDDGQPVVVEPNPGGWRRAAMPFLRLPRR